MKNLKWTTILLFICLAILFNIERLDFGKENVININSFVYVLAIISVILIIILPQLWRASSLIPVVLFLGVYFLCKTAVFKSSPLIGGIHTYVTITEITLLTIILWLAGNLSDSLKDFAEALEDFAMSGIKGRAKPLHKGIEDAQTEMLRSRRYGRPLGLIVVEPEPTSISVAKNLFIQEVQHAMMSHYVFTRVGNVISDLLRRTDMIMEQREKGRYVILCPETESSRFKILTERIQQSIAEQINVTVSCGVSSFPDESFTFEELVKKAENHLFPPFELSNTQPISSGSEEENARSTETVK